MDDGVLLNDVVTFDYVSELEPLIHMYGADLLTVLVHFFYH